MLTFFLAAQTDVIEVCVCLFTHSSFEVPLQNFIHNDAWVWNSYILMFLLLIYHLKKNIRYIFTNIVLLYL